MKRVKPASVPVLNSAAQADNALAEIAKLRRNIELIEAGMNENIDFIKKASAEEAAPLNDKLAALEQALKLYADYNKNELFTGRKSVDMTFGTIGYRQSSKLKLLPKMTWERVLNELLESGMSDCIRIREEPDKEKLRGLAPDALRDIGCKLVAEDVFFYECAEIELQNGDAA